MKFLCSHCNGEALFTPGGKAGVVARTCPHCGRSNKVFVPGRDRRKCEMCAAASAEVIRQDTRGRSIFLCRGCIEEDLALSEKC